MYERDEYGDYVDTIAPDGRQYLIALEDVEVYCMDKRLTDAELAAEFWKAKERCMFVGAFSGFSIRPDSPLAQQADVLRRFATLPHYDEQP